MKKYLLYAVTVCIMFVMPMKVHAAEAYAALSNDNTTLTFYYDNEKSSRNGMDIGPFRQWVDSNNKIEEDERWNGNYRQITTVIFDDSFAQYTDLQSTARWFKSFSNLTSILGIENLNTSNVTDMSGMFRGCKSLQSIDLKNFDTRNVEDMSKMFEECYALQTLDLSSFNTEKVTTMASMFENCYQSLAHINVSSFNTSNVTDMRKMFESCMVLKVLDLSSFNTSNVTNMRSMFSENSALTTIYVSDKWSTAKVEDGKGVFSKCNNIVGGSGTTWDKNHTDYTYAHIDGGASNPGYLTLKTGDIPDIDTDKVEAYAALSNDNTTLTFYYDNQKNSRNGMDIGPFKSENGEERGWFDQREAITSVVFDNSFADYRDLTSTRCWFVELENLVTISGIENLYTSNVTDMGFMFTECYRLSSIDVSHFDTKNVNNMDAMFAVCTNLTSLDLSNFDTSNVQNMKSVFECCYALKSLNISSFNTSNVTDMAYMFGDCYALENLDVSKFNTDNVTQMNIMFRACKKLEVLNLSSFNISKVKNMGQMFKNCEALTTIYVSDNWTIENAEWKSEENDKSKSIFFGCPKLVGGNGTTWDENHIDHTYAHIDGGEKNPGYLTYYKDDEYPKKEGDANGDGTLNDEDIKEVVNYILSNAYDILNMDAADINGDGVVNVADIVQIVKIIMGTK